MWDVDSATTAPIAVSVNAIAKSLEQHLKILSLGIWIKKQIQKALSGNFSATLVTGRLSLATRE